MGTVSRAGAVRLDLWGQVSDLEDWLKTVPQLSAQAVDVRERYVQWVKAQQQAAIDAQKAEKDK
jgi:hypothetical protein